MSSHVHPLVRLSIHSSATVWLWNTCSVCSAKMVKTFCASLPASSIAMRQVCHAAIASTSKGLSQTTAVIEARRRGERVRTTTLSSPAATKSAGGIAVDGDSICVVMDLTLSQACTNGIDLATRRAGAQPQDPRRTSILHLIERAG